LVSRQGIGVAAAGTRLDFDAAEAWHVWHDLEALALEA
jgi:hypothetical protein